MTLSTLVNAALVIAVVIYLIAKRMTWQEFAQAGRSVWTTPVILVGIGLVQMRSQLGDGYVVSTADIGFLVAGLATSLGAGALNGKVTEIQHRNGTAWYRMPAVGLVVLVGYLAARFALAALGHTMGATLTAGGGSIMVSMGANLLAQSLVTSSRIATGAPREVNA